MLEKIRSAVTPEFVKRHYAAKFVISILVVLLTIGLIGTVGYAQVNGIIEDDTENRIQASAGMQADSLAEWTQKMEYQTRSIARMDRVNEEHSAQRIREDLVPAQQELRDVSSVHVVDLESGTVLAQSANTASSEVGSGDSLAAVGEPWATPELAEATASRQLWISDGTYESQVVPNTRVVAFAVRAENSSRAVVVAATIETRIGQLERGDWTTAIVDRDGNVVIRPRDGDQSGIADGRTVTDERRLEAIDTALASDDRYLEVGDSVEAYSAVNGPGAAQQWVAVTTTPRSEAFAVQDAVGVNVLLIILGGIATLSVMGVVLGRQTVTPLRTLQQRVRAMEAGDLDVDLETDRRDEIGQLFGAFDSMRASLREQIRDAKSARDEAQAERERVRQINEELQRTADDYSSVMEQAAEGDLSARLRTDADNDAMAAIAFSFNEMLEELEQTVAKLTAFAAEVATASEQVTASSEEVRSASEQISESVQEISAGAERQHDSLRTVEEEMEDLSTTTEEIAASSNEVADIAERTARTGQTGRDAAKSAVEAMRSVEGDATSAVEEISRLESQVGEIDELIERIQDIADQTNMLALNANIEASRSAGGDAEGGFGVVAQEVKELSQDAKEAATEVEQRLESIREQTRSSADAVERTSDELDDATEEVADAVEALAEIAEFAEETHTGVQEISAATEQQAASTQEVVAMVDEATTISEETTAESENVAAAAEEQTTALTEVSRSASDLSEQAARLSEALDRFETDARLQGGPRMRMLEGEQADDAGDAAVDGLAEGDGAIGGAAADDGAAGGGRQVREPGDGRRGVESGDDGRAGSRDAVDDGLDDVDEADIAAFHPGVDASEFGADSAASEDDGADASEAESRDGQDTPTDGGTAVSSSSPEPPASGDGSAAASGSPAPGRDDRASADGPTDRTGADVFGGAARGGDGGADASESDAGAGHDGSGAGGAGGEPAGTGDTADLDDETAGLEEAFDEALDDAAVDLVDESGDAAETDAPGDDAATDEGTATDDAAENDETSRIVRTYEEEGPEWAEVARAGTTADDGDATAAAGDETDGVDSDETDSTGGEAVDDGDQATVDDAPEDASSDGAAAGADAADDERSLTDVHGVGEAKAESLREAGFESVADLRAADHDALANVRGIGDALATQIQANVADDADDGGEADGDGGDDAAETGD